MKVEDYVRTKNGLIFKIVGGNQDNWDLDISFGTLETFEENWLELFRYNDNGSFFNNKNIIKSSPNIIDLIQEGDYVNGQRVNYINNDREHFNISFGDEDFNLKSKFNSDIYWLSQEDIKSIVTKEQFSEMEYKL